MTTANKSPTSSGVSPQNDYGAGVTRYLRDANKMEPAKGALSASKDMVRRGGTVHADVARFGSALTIPIGDTGSRKAVSPEGEMRAHQLNQIFEAWDPAEAKG